MCEQKHLGAPEPGPTRTMSERKYMRFVNEIGGWSVLQTVLEALSKACSMM